MEAAQLGSASRACTALCIPPPAGAPAVFECWDVGCGDGDAPAAILVKLKRSRISFCHSCGARRLLHRLLAWLVLLQRSSLCMGTSAAWCAPCCSTTLMHACCSLGARLPQAELLSTPICQQVEGTAGSRTPAALPFALACPSRSGPCIRRHETCP